jgi:phage gpG-like protein
MAEMSMEEFKAKLDRWGQDFPLFAEKYLKRAAEEVRTEVVTKHLSGPTGPKSLSKKSGDLGNSITTSVKRSGGRIRALIGNLKWPLKYARIHEYGGIIKPKNSGFLKFKIGDRWIFAKEVRIPERSFLRSSLKDKRRAIIDLLTKAIKESYRDA